MGRSECVRMYAQFRDKTFYSLASADWLGLYGPRATLSLAKLNSGNESETLDVAIEVTNLKIRKTRGNVIQLVKVYAVESFPCTKDSTPISC